MSEPTVVGVIGARSRRGGRGGHRGDLLAVATAASAEPVPAIAITPAEPAASFFLSVMAVRFLGSDQCTQPRPGS